jgi:hypothetical protein
VGLDPAESDVPCGFFRLQCLSSNFIYKRRVDTGVLIESRGVWLSVYTVIFFPVVCIFFMYSSCFSTATCSDWLFVHLLSSLYFRLIVCLPVMYMAAPAPTPCSVLLPSVKIYMLLTSSLQSSRIVYCSLVATLWTATYRLSIYAYTRREQGLDHRSNNNIRNSLIYGSQNRMRSHLTAIYGITTPMTRQWGPCANR